MASLPESDPIADLLKRSRTIAVVGLSNSPLRPSHGVSAYMQTQGYRIIPVNPNIHGSLGEKAYPSLLEVPEKIDIVNIFRRSEFVEEAVDQAIRLKVPVIWMQEGVVHEKAAQKARGAGIFVLMDRCILKEHKPASVRPPTKASNHEGHQGARRKSKRSLEFLCDPSCPLWFTLFTPGRKLPLRHPAGPAPLAKTRTSARMLSAEASGCNTWSRMRSAPYSSSDRPVASVIPSL